MKLNNIMMVVVMVLGVTTVSYADQGKGKVTFTGSIIDAPCSITPETEDQTVNLGQVSNIALKDGGKSIPQKFTIKLEQCDLGTLTTVDTTFSGAISAANADLLAINGTASGASIAITDKTGTVIKLGDANTQNVTDGSNVLQFSAYLQGDGVGATIVPGDFSAVADFTLAYQ